MKITKNLFWIQIMGVFKSNCRDFVVSALSYALGVPIIVISSSNELKLKSFSPSNKQSMNHSSLLIIVSRFFTIRQYQ